MLLAWLSNHSYPLGRSCLSSHHFMSKAIEEVYAALKRSFQGSLLRPDDAEYPDARRIWNGLVARRPSLIARCKNSGDVRVAVRAAASTGVITAVRCGGHSLGGFSSCDDGLVIDLSPMRKVQVYEESRSARFEGLRDANRWTCLSCRRGFSHRSGWLGSRRRDRMAQSPAWPLL